MSKPKMSKGKRVWLIVVCIILMLLIAGNIALSTTTVSNLMNIVFGGAKTFSSGNGDYVYYAKTTGSKEEALAQGNLINEEICEEGIVLVKNENALPLPKGAKISVFGKNSVNLVYGGSGSGAGDNSAARTLYESLNAAGYETNPTLYAFYNDTAKSGNPRNSNPSDLDSGGNVMLSTAETPYSSYTANGIPDSYAAYSDAAIVVFSRIGGEGFDLPRTMADNGNAHYLELDENEQELLRQVTSAGFGQVIVVINSANTMELGFVKDNTYGKIDACLLMPGPGSSGVMALGRILSGEVNPSGHTVDTFVADFTQDPTWNNFGDNRVENGDRYNIDGANKLFYFVDYEEGIYVGYRYWETRGTEDEAWYQQNVVYPFGYGLSYTTFSQKLTNKDALTAINKDSNICLSVEVTNTGAVAGKDVVEVYATTPYTQGGIEKAAAVLVGFAKTGLLQPGESQTLEIAVEPYDFASYDYVDANGNGFFGYELEAGEYTLSIRSDAHTVLDSAVLTLAEGIQYSVDPSTGTPVVNRFEDADDQLSTVLSRADWQGTWPTSPDDAERSVSDAFISSLKDYSSNNPQIGSYSMPTQGANGTLVLSDMLVYNEEIASWSVDYDDPRWEKLLDRLTVDEMATLVSNGAFNSGAIASIQKPATTDADGPVGFTNFMGDPTVYGTCAYACEVMLASTWNVELVEKMGASVGEEALWGNVAGDGRPYSGWYAPAMNIHRSQFGGRNFEYYSEDSFLSGMMASAEIAGTGSKGVYCFIKHFALNEQETHRSIGGDLSWATEQAMREVFLKPFEKAVKVGGTTGVMSSFNRIGKTWTGGDYRLMTEVLRNEWGFRGSVISDFNTNSYMNCKQMVYAGGDLNLATNRRWSDYNAADANDVSVLRQATKNILYTVAKSNAMNGYGSNATHSTRLATWRIVQIAVDGVLLLALAVGTFLAFRKKNSKK